MYNNHAKGTQLRTLAFMALQFSVFANLVASCALIVKFLPSLLRG